MMHAVPHGLQYSAGNQHSPLDAKLLPPIAGTQQNSSLTQNSSLDSRGRCRILCALLQFVFLLQFAAFLHEHLSQLSQVNQKRKRSNGPSSGLQQGWAFLSPSSLLIVDYSALGRIQFQVTEKAHTQLKEVVPHALRFLKGSPAGQERLSFALRQFAASILF